MLNPIKEQVEEMKSAIQELKDAGKDFKIKWSIIDRAFPYKSGMKMCDLCSSERMHIALGKNGFQRLPPDCILLNKRSEIMGKCRHKLSYTLSKVKEEG